MTTLPRMAREIIDNGPYVPGQMLPPTIKTPQAALMNEMREFLLARGPNTDITGFAIIKDMCKEDLIDEILANQRKHLLTCEVADLKGSVVAYRVERYKESLISEAGIKVTPGIFGSAKVEDED